MYFKKMLFPQGFLSDKQSKKIKDKNYKGKKNKNN